MSKSKVEIDTHNDGWASAMGGTLIQDNPFGISDPKRTWWDEGWLAFVHADLLDETDDYDGDEI